MGMLTAQIQTGAITVPAISDMKEMDLTAPVCYTNITILEIL